MIKILSSICLSIAMLIGYYPKENKYETAFEVTCLDYTRCNACSNYLRSKFGEDRGTYSEFKKIEGYNAYK